MSAWLGRQWFLIALAIVLLVGSVVNGVLRPLTEAIPRDALVAAILLAMSAPLDLRKSLSSRAAIAAAMIGVAVNVLLAGPLAWLFGWPLDQSLAIGLIIAALSPCTLASAAVWTRRGGGNDAVALAVTVATNLGAFLTIPIGMLLLVGSVYEIDAVAMTTRLLLVVVAPITLGQLLRTQTWFHRGADQYRTPLSIAAQIGLLGMVLIGAVRIGPVLSDPAAPLTLGQGALLAIAAATVHLALFAIAWSLARASGLPRAEALGAAVAGSQKTLAVGLTMAMDFGPLAILPMIYYHALQLLLDAFLVDWLQVKGPERSESAP